MVKFEGIVWNGRFKQKIMKKVFIVDDDEAILEALQVALESSGYIVETESDGNKVEERVAESQPDLVLLDLLLSGMDGGELAASLKRNTKTSEIPLILLSAHPNASESARVSGVDDFMPKPFDVEDLIGKIQKYTA